MKPESEPKPKSNEPSLGPACAFFFLLACAVFSLSLIFIAWWMSGSQHIKASSALKTQLIPWIEDSALSKPDRESITERLNELTADMDADRLSGRQLSRLNFRLSGQPLFQWGVVEEVQRQANGMADLSDAEKQALNVACDRLLRTVLDGKVAMEQMEFAAQEVAKKEPKSGRLIPQDGLSAAKIQEFLRRIIAVSDRAKTENDPLEKSVSQVFREMMDDAIKEK